MIQLSRQVTVTGLATAGAGAVQINLVISTALAASLLAHGSVTYIYMADRLNQLPLITRSQWYVTTRGFFNCFARRAKTKDSNCGICTFTTSAHATGS